MKDECGIVGLFNVDDSAALAYYSLHAMQHRGQEGCGIVGLTKNGQKLIKGEGLITEVFNESKLAMLDGQASIGHVRYPTVDGGGTENIQPFLFKDYTGDFSISNSGCIVNSSEIRRELENTGSIFQSSSDAELIAHLIKKDSKSKKIDAIKAAMRMTEGSFTYVLLTEDKLYAVRDKHGLKPFVLGKIGSGYIVASESCVFSVIGATFIRDIEPGEIITISKDGITSDKYSDYQHYYMCAMEYIYFARPDSDIDKVNCHLFRKDSGRCLAKIKPVIADMVVGVPDSSLSAAMGYAEASGIPYEIGLIKNKYIGRTFIQPNQRLREKSVKMKLSAIPTIVNGKSIILVDDSIVRGTTSKFIIGMLREAGATQVHVRIASAPLIKPCYYGVDITTKEELISSNNDCETVRKIIGADSLAFLNVDDLYSISKRKELCLACFTGKYPINTYKENSDE